jgi:hypothetical protein
MTATRTGLGERLSPAERTGLRVRVLAECWARDRRTPLPSGSELADLIGQARKELKRCEAELMPCGEVPVSAFLDLFARRHALPPPEAPALALDLAIMGSWPPDLFDRAAHAVWESFSERRLPAAGDFMRHIGRELRDRRNERNRLHDFLLSLETRRRAEAGLPPAPLRPAPLAHEGAPVPWHGRAAGNARRSRRRQDPAQLLLFA